MAIDFPNTPTVGQTFTSNGRTWQYTSAGVWDSLAANTSPGDFSVDGSFTASNYDVAGKNKIINGGFDIWQRGTSFTVSGSANYTADRWYFDSNGTGATKTVSRQEFTPGSFNLPTIGDASYFLRFNQSVAGTGGAWNVFNQRIEDVRTLAGSTFTYSFWAKSDAPRDISLMIFQQFGSGGSATSSTGYGLITTSTSWKRYSFTGVIPSTAGKTIGAGSFIQLELGMPSNTVQTIDFYGMQLEAGSIATPFSRAGGTIAGELAACQRYYVRFDGTQSGYDIISMGSAGTATSCEQYVKMPVPLRVKAHTLEWSSLRLADTNTAYAVTGVNLVTTQSGVHSTFLGVNVASGLTVYRPHVLQTNSGNGFVGLSAEL